jgi:hypothetical protein
LPRVASLEGLAPERNGRARREEGSAPSGVRGFPHLTCWSLKGSGCRVQRTWSRPAEPGRPGSGALVKSQRDRGGAHPCAFLPTLRWESHIPATLVSPGAPGEAFGLLGAEILAPSRAPAKRSRTMARILRHSDLESTAAGAGWRPRGDISVCPTILPTSVPVGAPCAKGPRPARPWRQSARSRIPPGGAGDSSTDRGAAGRVKGPCRAGARSSIALRRHGSPRPGAKATLRTMSKGRNR